MSGPTPTALAAKALMERIDNTAYRQVIQNRAVLGGWAGARGSGLWDTRISDAVAIAAVDAVMDLMRGWAAECGEAKPA